MIYIGRFGMGPIINGLLTDSRVNAKVASFPSPAGIRPNHHNAVGLVVHSDKPEKTLAQNEGVKQKMNRLPPTLLLVPPDSVKSEQITRLVKSNPQIKHVASTSLSYEQIVKLISEHLLS